MKDIWRWSLGRYVYDIQLAEGERLPSGHGIAWRLPYSYGYYCLPMPLNRIVGSFRAWWLQWRLPCPDDPIAAAFDYGKSLGFSEGRKSGEAQTHRLYGVLLREIARP